MGPQSWADEHVVDLGGADGSAFGGVELRARLAAIAAGRVVVRGGLVEGDLDLDGLDAPLLLVFDRVVFTGEVRLADARFRGLVMSGCRCAGLLMPRASIDRVRLDSCVLSGPIDPLFARPQRRYDSPGIALHAA